MINITRGNDFQLAVTFTRGGEDYNFDSISSVSLFGALDRKYSQAFSYSDGKLTVKGSHSLAAGVYGLEIIGKEGGAVRRTAFNRVVAITNTTTAGSYDPEEEVDEYDIAIHMELDLSVDKSSATSSETKSDDTNSGTEPKSGSDSGSSASGSDTGSTGTEGKSTCTEEEG